MPHLRIVVRPLQDRTAELRVAADLRRDLYAHSPVELDPDNQVHGTHRRADGRAYFEFATEMMDEVNRVLRDFHYESRVDVEEVGTRPAPCINCGNVSVPMQPAVCPTCGFVEISRCPNCDNAMPRETYQEDVGNILRCQNCNHRVRMRYHDPLFDAKGHYIQPLIIVESAA